MVAESSQLKSTNQFRKARARLLGVPQLFFGLKIPRFLFCESWDQTPKINPNPNFSKSQQAPPLHWAEKEISKINQLQTSREWLLTSLTEETPHLQVEDLLLAVGSCPVRSSSLKLYKNV